MVSAFWQPLPALPTSLSHFLASFTHRLLMLMLMVTQKKVAIDKNNLPNLDIAPAAVDEEYEFSSDILKLYLSTQIFWKSKGKGTERSTPSCKVRSQFFPSLPFSKVKMYFCKSVFLLRVYLAGIRLACLLLMALLPSLLLPTYHKTLCWKAATKETIGQFGTRTIWPQSVKTQCTPNCHVLKNGRLYKN